MLDVSTSLLFFVFMSLEVYKKVGLLSLARQWILVRQFPETFGNIEVASNTSVARNCCSSQCFSQRPTLLSITNRSYGPQLNFVHAMLMAPRTPFLLSVVPTCMGNPLWLGNTGSTSWFFWLRNMVLILRSTGPYSFMAKISLS